MAIAITMVNGNKKIQTPTTLRQAQCDNWNLEFLNWDLFTHFNFIIAIEIDF